MATNQLFAKKVIKGNRHELHQINLTQTRLAGEPRRRTNKLPPAWAVALILPRRKSDAHGDSGKLIALRS
jgi:hypothetical protein